MMKAIQGKVIEADCLEYLNTIHDKSIGVVVTSPPYNIRNSSGNGFRSDKNPLWTAAALGHGYENHKDNMPYPEYVRWQREVLTQCMRVLKDNGAIFYNHKWRVQNGIIQDRREIVDGFPVRQVIIWNRKGGVNFNKQYFLPTYEVIYLIAKPDFRLQGNMERLGDIWEVTPTKGTGHPASFPYEIPLRCIKASKGPVLDPFLGSGTTAIAAIAKGRKWYGCDNSPEYCSMASITIEQFKKQNWLPGMQSFV